MTHSVALISKISHLIRKPTIGYHHGQAGGIGDEACGHHKRQGRCRTKAQRRKHRDDDWSQDQCCTIVCEQCLDGCTEQDHQRKQPSAFALTPSRHVKRCPFEESRFIKQQTDDDHCNEGRCRVPDYMPYNQHIPRADYARQQCPPLLRSSRRLNPSIAR